MSQKKCNKCEKVLKPNQHGLCASCKVKSEGGGIIRTGLKGAAWVAGGLAVREGVKFLKNMKKK